MLSGHFANNQKNCKKFFTFSHDDNISQHDLEKIHTTVELELIL